MGRRTFRGNYDYPRVDVLAVVKHDTRTGDLHDTRAELDRVVWQGRSELRGDCADPALRHTARADRDDAKDRVETPARNLEFRVQLDSRE